LEKDIPRKKRSIAKTLSYIIFGWMIAWFFIFFSSLLFIEKYPKFIFLIMLSGIIPTALGLFVGPFLSSKLGEEESKALIEEVKTYEPVVEARLLINNGSVEQVYEKTLDWLESLDARVYEKTPPVYVLAFHVVYDSKSSGIGYAGEVANWEKFFLVKLIENEGVVTVNMEIHQGWKKTGLDRYGRRKRVWPRFIENYRSYLGAIIESKNEAVHDVPDEAFMERFFWFQGRFFPLGIGPALLFIACIVVFICFPDRLVNVDLAWYIIGLTLFVSLIIFYMIVKS
jgi:hypothetical protein